MEPSKSVYVIGAGLSRALSSSMPITDKLGNEVVKSIWAELHKSGSMPEFSDGSFEAWLSALAEPQPYLNEVDNAYNRADLLKILRAVFDIVTESERLARQDLAPWWPSLTLTLFADFPEMITFNYDTLVEWLMTLNAPSWTAMHTITAQLPGMIKLHGSVDRFWIPGDSTSVPQHHDPYAEEQD